MHLNKTKKSYFSDIWLNAECIPLVLSVWPSDLILKDFEDEKVDPIKLGSLKDVVVGCFHTLMRLGFIFGVNPAWD